MAELCNVARLDDRWWCAGCGLSYLVNFADTESYEVVDSKTRRSRRCRWSKQHTNFRPQLFAVMSVLDDSRRPVRYVFGLEQRALFVELCMPGCVRCVATCCSKSSLETSGGALHVAAFTVEPRRLGTFPDDNRLCRHMLVYERA